MKLTTDLSDAFLTGAIRIAWRCGMEPIHLLGVMAFESVGIRANARNHASSATGILQFMGPWPSDRFPFTRDQFAALSLEEQLPYVERHFKPYVPLGLHSLGRVYVAVLLPAALNIARYPVDKVCGLGGPYDFAYRANKALDRGNKGFITIEDCEAHVASAMKTPRFEEVRLRVDALLVEKEKHPMFRFELMPGEAVNDRVVRCCDELLAEGPLGAQLRQDVYGDFINCNLKPAGKLGDAYVQDISGWITSCALFVRAVLAWCGRTTKIAVNASGIYAYLQADETHPAWVRWTGIEEPAPGDVFYCASTGSDGHVGIFLRELEPGVWETAEGGGSDGKGGAVEGSLCKRTRRAVKTGREFDPYRRPLRGWWRCTGLGLPASPDIPYDPTPSERLTPVDRPALDVEVVEVTRPSTTAPALPAPKAISVRDVVALVLGGGLVGLVALIQNHC